MTTTRLATAADVSAVIGFGEAVIPVHYAPLLGQEEAGRQLEHWWSYERLAPVADEGKLIVAEENGDIVGVAEWGLYEGVPIVWKLYVSPQRRGQGIGPQLLAAVEAILPADASRLRVEHFESNRGAGRFYEREGFQPLHTRVHDSDPRLNVVWREKSLD